MWSASCLTRCFYLADAGIPEPPNAVTAQRSLVEHLEHTWNDKGHGLWESRAGPERYTYSAVMAWVGVDRFIRGARGGKNRTAHS